MLQKIRQIDEQKVDSEIQVHFQDVNNNQLAMKSNFWRELHFVTHHAVHHMATIKIICANFDLELPKDFGVAPSTQNAYDLYLLSSKIKKFWKLT